MILKLFKQFPIGTQFLMYFVNWKIMCHLFSCLKLNKKNLTRYIIFKILWFGKIGNYTCIPGGFAPCSLALASRSPIQPSASPSSHRPVCEINHPYVHASNSKTSAPIAEIQIYNARRLLMNDQKMTSNDDQVLTKMRKNKPTH